jgi:hypothetical protein
VSRRSSLNRTQGLVLGFFASAWAALVVTLVAAPGVYGGVLPGGDVDTNLTPSLAKPNAISELSLRIHKG